MPVQRQLARRRIGSCQPAVGSTPDASDTASSAHEQRCRCQTHKRKQQRILDQVLALFVLDEVVEKRIHVDTSNFLGLMSLCSVYHGPTWPHRQCCIWTA